MPKERHGSKVARQKLERGQVGIAGEYAVLTELIIHGFAAARTDGNSKDIDILCSHINTGQVANVQVKTLNFFFQLSICGYFLFLFRFIIYSFFLVCLYQFYNDLPELESCSV